MQIDNRETNRMKQTAVRNLSRLGSYETSKPKLMNILWCDNLRTRRGKNLKKIVRIEGGEANLTAQTAAR